MVLSKSALAIQLSKLKVFEKVDVSLEQYPTDSEIAAEVLSIANMRGEIENKIIADLGCGTGILGIGALLLGAKKVYFVDIDNNALDILKKNLSDLGIKFCVDSGVKSGGKSGIKSSVKLGTKLKTVIINSDVNNFDKRVDIVIQNPPFGTRDKHIDKKFLEKAFLMADVIYSFHKSSTDRFVSAITKDNGFEITNRFDYKFPLKQVLIQHKKKIHRIDVTCFRLAKKGM